MSVSDSEHDTYNFRYFCDLSGLENSKFYKECRLISAFKFSKQKFCNFSLIVYIRRRKLFKTPESNFIWYRYANETKCKR